MYTNATKIKRQTDRHNQAHVGFARSFAVQTSKQLCICSGLGTSVAWLKKVPSQKKQFGLFGKIKHASRAEPYCTSTCLDLFRLVWVKPSCNFSFFSEMAPKPNPQTVTVQVFQNTSFLANPPSEKHEPSWGVTPPPAVDENFISLSRCIQFNVQQGTNKQQSGGETARIPLTA